MFSWISALEHYELQTLVYLCDDFIHKTFPGIAKHLKEVTPPILVSIGPRKPHSLMEYCRSLQNVWEIGKMTVQTQCKYTPAAFHSEQEGQV
jgi:hypothetical protein